MGDKSGFGLRRLDEGPRSKTLDKEKKSSLLQRHLGQINDLLKEQPKRHTEQQLKIEREKRNNQLCEEKDSELERIRQRYQVGQKSGCSWSETDYEANRRELIKRQRVREQMRNEEEAIMIHSTRKEDRLTNKAFKPKWYEMDHKKRIRENRSEQLMKQAEEPRNVWTKRQESLMKKSLELQNMLPRNEEDEELMLQKAIELSKQAADEDYSAHRSLSISRTQLKSIWDIEPEGADVVRTHQPNPTHIGYASAVKGSWANALAPMGKCRGTNRDLPTQPRQRDTSVNKENVLPRDILEMSSNDGQFYQTSISKHNRTETKQHPATVYNDETLSLPYNIIDKACNEINTLSDQKEYPSRSAEDWNEDVMGEKNVKDKPEEMECSKPKSTNEQKGKKSTSEKNKTFNTHECKEDQIKKMESSKVEGCMEGTENQSSVPDKRKTADGSKNKRKVGEMQDENEEGYNFALSLTKSPSVENFHFPRVSFCKSNVSQKKDKNLAQKSKSDKMNVTDKENSAVLKSGKEVENQFSVTKVCERNSGKDCVDSNKQVISRKEHQLPLQSNLVIGANTDKTEEEFPLNTSESFDTPHIDNDEDGKGHVNEKSDGCSDETRIRSNQSGVSRCGTGYQMIPDTDDRIPDGLPHHLHAAYFRYLQKTEELPSTSTHDHLMTSIEQIQSSLNVIGPVISDTGGYSSGYTMPLNTVQAQEMIRQCQKVSSKTAAHCASQPTETYTNINEISSNNGNLSHNVCNPHVDIQGNHQQSQYYKIEGYSGRVRDENMCNEAQDDSNDLKSCSDKVEDDCVASVIRLKGKLGMSSPCDLRIPKLPSVASRLTNRYLNSVDIDMSNYTSRKRRVKTEVNDAKKSKLRNNSSHSVSPKVQFENSSLNWTSFQKGNADPIFQGRSKSTGNTRALLRIPKENLTDEECGLRETGDFKEVCRENKAGFDDKTVSTHRNVSNTNIEPIKKENSARLNNQLDISGEGRAHSYFPKNSTESQVFQNLVMKEYGGLVTSSGSLPAAYEPEDVGSFKRLPKSDQAALEENLLIRNMIKAMRLKEPCETRKTMESGDAPNMRLY